MEPFRSLESASITDQVLSECVSESYILSESVEKLRRLSSNKATGSDGIPNWLLKEYADILSHPISSFTEKRLKSPPNVSSLDTIR